MYPLPCFLAYLLILIGMEQLLAMKRVGILSGGHPLGVEDKAVPPSQRLKIARYNELSGSPYASSAAYSDGEGILG